MTSLVKFFVSSTFVFVLAAGAWAADETASSDYPDHRQLGVWRDAEGEHPVKTPEDWARRRAHILDGMQQAMGKLPDRSNLPPLDVKVEETFDGTTFTRQKISFVAEGNDRVPAYLFIPKGLDGKRVPGILALHQTTPLGKKEPAGLGPSENKHYGLELAKRGYVVVVPDYPSFGDYEYDFDADSYTSGSMKGIFNHTRAVDLLVSRPDVDPERIGAIGHSLGGHNSMFVGVFDERIKVIVSSCGWTPFHHYYGGKLDGWTSDRYMPSIRTVYKLDPDRVPFDMYEIVAAFAPRAFFSVSPLHDGNFDVAGVRKVIAAARPIYELLGVPQNLQVRYPDSPHDFPPKQRHESYEFIDQILHHTPREDFES
ncbi:MAG: alpha/beta fold hydrolase, partial [Planctomycetes bacterium]|nr:alpha/beta fold hydrolase [Planctomycetota bacterium]